MRFILIRHGETKWNEMRRFQGLSDIELSPKGKRQAENLAESMRWEKIQALYTSPLLRARKTAEEIACFHNCSVAIDDRLKELNLGKLEGLDSTELKKRYPDFLKHWVTRPDSVSLPGGESLGDVQKRAWAFMTEICRKYAEGTVVAVAHSFVNQTILCRILEIPLDYFRRIRQDATAKNIIDFSHGRSTLDCLNDTCHLRGPDQTAKG